MKVEFTLEVTMRRAKVLLCGSVLGLAVSACTFAPGSSGSAGGGAGSHGIGTGTGTGTGGTSGHGIPTGSGTGIGTGTGGSSPTADGPNCGLQTFGLQNVPPDLLIVLDKSGSMAHQFDDMACPGGGGACMDKWTAMQMGLTQVVAATDGTIRWGLKFFPSDNGCGVNNGVDVPVAATNATMVNAGINGLATPRGNTPTRTGVRNATAYLMGLADPNPKFILLATDGLPNCMPNGGGNTASDAAGAVQAVADAATAGIPTFVVGVGNVAGAEMTLTQMATAGGRPQAAAPGYYPVRSTAELVTVLGTIGGQIASCTFNLGSVPPDPSNIAVNADGKRVPKDTTHANGWDYGTGMKSVELFGSYCDQVKAKTIKDVQAIFGCPGVIIP